MHNSNVISLLNNCKWTLSAVFAFVKSLHAGEFAGAWHANCY